MNNKNVKLTLANGKLTCELYKFLSISLDADNFNLSNENKTNLLEKLREQFNEQPDKTVSVKDDNNKIDELLLMMIDTVSPKIPYNLLFHKTMPKKMLI